MIVGSADIEVVASPTLFTGLDQTCVHHLFQAGSGHAPAAVFLDEGRQEFTDKLTEAYILLSGAHGGSVAR